MTVVVRRDLYGTKTASEVTSEIYWVGDAISINLFLRGSPSTTTVQGSTANGRDAAIAETSWSDLTVVVSPSPDMLDIQPGFGWIRGLRSETTEMTLQLVNSTGGGR